MVAVVAGLTGTWFQPSSFVLLAILGAAAGLFYSLAVVAPLLRSPAGVYLRPLLGARQGRRLGAHHAQARPSFRDAVMDPSPQTFASRTSSRRRSIPTTASSAGRNATRSSWRGTWPTMSRRELISFGPRERTTDVGQLRVRVLRAHDVRGQRTNPISASLWSALADATVVHCHQQHVLASSVAAVLTRLRRRRVFVTDLGGGGFDISGYVSTDRWFHGHLHISEYSRKVAGQEHNPRARVILGGVDTPKFSPGPGGDGTVLFVGRLLPHKGVHDLIDAVPPTFPCG